MSKEAQQVDRKTMAQEAIDGDARDIMSSSVPPELFVNTALIPDPDGNATLIGDEMGLHGEAQA